MKKVSWKNMSMLLLTAVIWGVAFVAQSVGMEYIGPFTFNFVRNIIGGLVLIPCIWFLNKWKEKEGIAENTEQKQDTKTLIVGGICCGIALCLASNLQQIGIQYTTVGKAGFITALYIVIVPIVGIFLKKKCGIQIWISVLIALAGFYLLSVKDGFKLEAADTYLLCSAVLFSIHILIIDYFSPKVDGVKMSCIQFFVCGILSGVMMLLTETPSLDNILEAWMPILYAGVLSCGVAYTLQIVGQKDFNPTIASLILSLESVVATISGWVAYKIGFLKTDQSLTGRQIAGCAIVFAAVILVQLPEEWFRLPGKRRKASNQ